MSAFRIDDLPIESGMLTSALDEAQRKVRGASFIYFIHLLFIISNYYF